MYRCNVDKISSFVKLGTSLTGDRAPINLQAEFLDLSHRYFRQPRLGRAGTSLNPLESL